MSHMIQPTMLLLKEGTENSQGKEQIISNINACSGLVEIVKTTLVFFNFLIVIYRVPEEWTK